jgi:hypothetical protein
MKLKTTTRIVIACILASPIAAGTAAAESFEAKCFNAETNNDLTTWPDHGPNYEGGVPDGYWEIASIQYTSFYFCDRLADLYACITDGATCTPDESADIAAHGITYQPNRPHPVTRHDGCSPVMTDYEILVTYNTKGVTGSTTPVCLGSQPVPRTPAACNVVASRYVFCASAPIVDCPPVDSPAVLPSACSTALRLAAQHGLVVGVGFP